MDYSLPGSSDYGISQARITEWVAIPFSRDFPDAGIEPRAPALQADSLLSESPGKPQSSFYLCLKKGVFFPIICAAISYTNTGIHKPTMQNLGKSGKDSEGAL